MKPGRVSSRGAGLLAVGMLLVVIALGLRWCLGGAGSSDAHLHAVSASSSDDESKHDMSAVSAAEGGGDSIAPSASRQVPRAMQQLLTVEARALDGQPLAGCDILVCRRAAPEAWRYERSDSIVYRVAPEGPIYTMPGDVMPDPQPLGEALVVGITDSTGLSRLEIPAECSWATVWCRADSIWLGKPWSSGIHEVRFVVEPGCDIAGNLVSRAGGPIVLPSSAMLVGQDPETGMVHAARLDELGAFVCPWRPGGKALLRLVDAGDWCVEPPAILQPCGDGARVFVEQVESVSVVDEAGLPHTSIDLLVLELGTHGVLSRRSSVSSTGRHRVWQPDVRAELAQWPNLLLLRAEGYVSRMLVRPLGRGPCALVRGFDPRLEVRGRSGDMVRVDIGSEGAPISPQSLIVEATLPGSGVLALRVPADVPLRVEVTRTGQTIVQREILVAHDTVIIADGATAGRLVVQVEGDWAAEVVAASPTQLHRGGRFGAGLWQIADLPAGEISVWAVPKSDWRSWREPLGIRSVTVCEIFVGAETRVHLPPASIPPSRIVILDAQGKLLPNLEVRDQRTVSRVSGPDGAIEAWTDWQPPLALASTPAGAWLPLELRADSDHVIAVAEMRWLEALGPMHVRVFLGQVERAWKSITFTSTERIGRFVVYPRKDSPGVAVWPTGLDGVLDIEVALQGGGRLRAESVVVAGGGSFELRGPQEEGGDWCRLRLKVSPRQSGVFETVQLTVFDARQGLLRAGDFESLAVRTGAWTQVATRSGPKRIVVKARLGDQTIVWSGNVTGDQMEVKLDW